MNWFPLQGSIRFLMLKLDGLTVKLTYEDGKLAEAATRVTEISPK
ncbi:hypothetical protein D7X88_07655 [bacterium C-53]|nr:hypothetical protein [Lachnospiraceae bacterium]NBI03092.1 hypothetical protein [Lachnospiraceae bacterium]RKJ10700.1 hypothetical protein D7X88_07655 [bacterium C-53]